MNLVQLLQKYANGTTRLSGESGEDFKNSADYQADLDERAAIMEHDGGLSKEEAEREAKKCLLERGNLNK